MAIVSVGDVLDRALKFEERLKQRYGAIRDESENDGVRLLTYYLSRHRHHLQQALKDLKPDEIDRIRGIKLKYDIEVRLEEGLQIMEGAVSDLTGAGLLDAAAGHDEELISLYKSILKQPLSAEGVALFESLVRVEERDIVMIKKMTAMNYF